MLNTINNKVQDQCLQNRRDGSLSDVRRLDGGAGDDFYVFEMRMNLELFGRRDAGWLAGIFMAMGTLAQISLHDA
jgi:hypothetical protein